MYSNWKKENTVERHTRFWVMNAHEYRREQKFRFPDRHFGKNDVEETRDPKISDNQPNSEYFLRYFRVVMIV